MKKVLILLLALGAVLAAATFLDPTRTLLGYFRGESRYRNRPASYWRQELLADSPLRQDEARRALQDGGAEAVPVLVAATKDEDALVREHAAEAMGDIGPVAAEGVPALVALLSDPEARVRRDAVRSLGQIGAAASGALPDVLKRVKDSDA